MRSRSPSESTTHLAVELHDGHEILAAERPDYRAVAHVMVDPLDGEVRVRGASATRCTSVKVGEAVHAQHAPR